MQEQAQLAELLKFLTDTLQQGKDFTLAQAPLFVKELLMWQVMQAWIFIGVWTVVALILVTFVRKFFIYAACLHDDEDSRRTLNYGMFTTAGVILLIAWATNLWTIIEVYVAPRVVVLEMVRSLISSH